MKSSITSAMTKSRFARRSLRMNRSRQTGLTLIELLVALTISTVITIAAVSALIVSRQGFTAVDTASQLRDNARFATDLIQRLGVQAGYQDIQFITSPRGNDASAAVDPFPNIFGFNNALAGSSFPIVPTTRPIGPTFSGSDVLLLSFQAGETFPGSGVSDNTMIDCMGNPSTTPPISSTDRIVSILHVRVDASGEPSLMCSTVNPAMSDPQPLIRGVENFQILYGVDGVVPNTTPGAAAADPVPRRFLRADQMVVPGNDVATNANWRRVRSIRIGMVFRGPPNSAPDNAAITYYPLGQARASNGGTVGSALSAAADPGTIFEPGADGRLRQVMTFTVHLRNSQEL